MRFGRWKKYKMDDEGLRDRLQVRREGGGLCCLTPFPLERSENIMPGEKKNLSLCRLNHSLSPPTKELSRSRWVIGNIKLTQGEMNIQTDKCLMKKSCVLDSAITCINQPYILGLQMARLIINEKCTHLYMNTWQFCILDWFHRHEG